VSSKDLILSTFFKIPAAISDVECGLLLFFHQILPDHSRAFWRDSWWFWSLLILCRITLFNLCGRKLWERNLIPWIPRCWSPEPKTAIFVPSKTSNIICKCLRLTFQQLNTSLSLKLNLNTWEYEVIFYRKKKLYGNDPLAALGMIHKFRCTLLDQT